MSYALAAKSAMSVLREQQEALTKSLSSPHSDSAYGLPKSWFNDPYALLDSMGLGYRASPSTLSFETLRAMAEKNVVVASVIQTRVNQVAAFCQPQRNEYSVGLKVQHRDPKRKLTDGEKQFCKQLERFVMNMGVDRDPERDSLEMFIRKVVRDRLVYDQLTAEKVLRRNGKPHSVFAVDASGIRIATPRNKKGTPLTRWEAEATPKYTQVVDGTIVNEYTRKEFIFRVANPRTDLKVYGYGFSELEMLIRTITSHLYAEDWNSKAFSQGATTKGIINIKGNVQPAQLEAFKRQWLTQVSGVSNAWRTPVMNSEELQWIPLQPSNNDMGYQSWLEYLIKVACAVYLMDPAEINFDTRSGVGTQPMFMTTNEAQQKVSKDRGLQPLLRFVQTMINEDLIWEIDENFEMLFVGLDAQNETQAVELTLKELQAFKTLNEVRRAKDLPPVPNGDMVMNPVYVGMMQQQQQAAAMGGAPGAPGGAAPQPPPGAPTAPGGGGEMYEQLFGKPKDRKFGKEEQGLGAHMEKEAETTPEQKPSNEPMSRDESEEEWESTIHASHRGYGRVLGELSDDLQKALTAFDGLEE